MDEGIVQPFSKVKDKLSRRLHQFVPRHLPGNHGGIVLNSYKQTQKLKQTEAAYIAGLVDGEGTVTLTRKHKNEQRQLCLSISSTEKPLLNFVKSATGVGKITTKKVAKIHHSPSFTYAVYNRQALNILLQINPFLISYKQARAQLILETYLEVTPRNGKYSKKLLARKDEFERAVLMMKPGT